MYYSGDGVVKNLNESLSWLQLAAEKNDPVAQNLLGLIYSAGDVVEKDFQKAMKLHTLSAEQGLAAAKTNIGVMFCEGQGVTKDPVLGRMWFLLAATDENADGELPTNEHVTALDNIHVIEKSMAPEQIDISDNLALEKDKRVLRVLLLLSDSYLSDPSSIYRDPVRLADHFFENYLVTFLKSKKHLILPSETEVKKWAISDTELRRCMDEGVLLGALGVSVTVRNNKPNDYHSVFVDQLVNRLRTMSLCKDGESGTENLKNVMEEYVAALNEGRIVHFAATYTERVFSGNVNEPDIFAANFWSRPFDFAMSTMGASKNLFIRCMANEVLKNESTKI